MREEASESQRLESEDSNIFANKLNGIYLLAYGSKSVLNSVVSYRTWIKPGMAKFNSRAI